MPEDIRRFTPVVELPEAKEGDEAPAPTAIAFDPEEGTLLVPEEVN